MMRRRFTRIQTYIGKEYLLSFFVSFLFFFFIFFINQMLLLAEDVLAKKVPVLDVMLLILYSLPAVVAIAFPFASLVGALMAMGRLSSDNETVAFQASGVPMRKLFYPVLALGIVLSFGSFIMNDYFLPLGTMNFSRLWRRLLSTNPELEIEPYSIKKFEKSIIITGNVRGKEIEDIVIFDSSLDLGKRIISADKGRLIQNEEQKGSVVSLELDDVFTQNVSTKKGNEFEYDTSEKMIYNILIADFTPGLTNPSAREMSSLDLYTMIKEREKDVVGTFNLQKRKKVAMLNISMVQKYHSAAEEISYGNISAEKVFADLESDRLRLITESARKINDRTLQLNWLEFHKKFSIPFACFFFVILAFPVGLLARRSGRSVGFITGLMVSILYWGMLIGGQTIGTRTNLSPAFSMWFPNIVILALGILFFIIRFKR